MASQCTIQCSMCDNQIDNPQVFFRHIVEYIINQPIHFIFCVLLIKGMIDSFPCILPIAVIGICAIIKIQDKIRPSEIMVYLVLILFLRRPSTFLVQRYFVILLNVCFTYFVSYRTGRRDFEQWNWFWRECCCWIGISKRRRGSQMQMLLGWILQNISTYSRLSSGPQASALFKFLNSQKVKNSRFSKCGSNIIRLFSGKIVFFSAFVREN